MLRLPNFKRFESLKNDVTSRKVVNIEFYKKKLALVIRVVTTYRLIFLIFMLRNIMQFPEDKEDCGVNKCKFATVSAPSFFTRNNCCPFLPFKIKDI